MIFYTPVPVLPYPYKNKVFQKLSTTEDEPDYQENLRSGVSHPGDMPRSFPHGTYGSGRKLSSTNEKVLSEEAIWSALADRDGFQYVQTQLGFCRPGTSALQPSSGDLSASLSSQPDDSQASNLSSIQSRTVSIFSIFKCKKYLTLCKKYITIDFEG
jgi:hypothetical protein